MLLALRVGYVTIAAKNHRIVSITWTNLRPWNGSQPTGFEELCTQLAHAEPPELNASFRRKGAPDAGVECYWTLSNGDEIGWQAKFFLHPPDDDQWGAIQASFVKALEKHPRLVRYVVCLPIDRQDPRRPRQRWFMQRWDAYVDAWTNVARARGRSVAFEYWGEHEIAMRLSRDHHAGRHLFWFGDPGYFSQEWFQRRAASVIEDAGVRYTPEVHVSLPIAQLFDGLARTPMFFDGFLEVCGKLTHELAHTYPPAEADLAAAVQAGKDACVTVSDRLLALDRREAFLPIDFDVIADATNQAGDQIDAAIRLLRPEGRDRTEHNSALYRLYNLTSILSDIRERVMGDGAAAANRGALLVVGEAGMGKTHLLCDVTADRTAANAASVLFLGEQFGGNDPWRQMLDRLDLTCSADQFLGALSASAEARRGRALIAIDALNESEPRSVWKRRLAGMLADLRRYPNVVLAVSARSSYVDEVIPSNITGTQLVRATHIGFSDSEYEAVRTFFAHYGVPQPTVPLLNPEFSQPLFLKLFCVGLAGRTDLPRGARGISSIFGFFLNAIHDKLRLELGYDPSDNLVRRAVDALVSEMAVSGKRWVSRSAAKALIDPLLRAESYDRSLFRRLLVEGVIAEDRFYVRPGATEDGIRFSYERLADHLLVERLLRDHAPNREALAAAFALTGTIGRRLRERRELFSSGLLEALAVQLPERFGVEVADLLPDLASSTQMRRAMLQSVIWRDVAAFTSTLLPYVKAHVLGTREGLARWLEILLTVAGSAEHPYNARYLHGVLCRYSMPARDAWWSTFAYETYGEHGPVDRLVDWALSPDDKAHMSDEAVQLVALALAWFLTTSHRSLRDRATKALVRLLTTRLHVLQRVLAEFENVDDLYVQERLYAAAYGAALRSSDAPAIGSLARDVYARVFASGTPIPHILLRDAARGVIERAAALGVADGIDVTRARPPYQSTWPTTVPSASELKAKYGQPPQESGDAGYAQSAIYFSVMGGGDFDRYVIGTNSHSFEWTADRLGEPVPLTRRERYDAFVETLTERQREALERLEDARRRPMLLLIQRASQDETEVKRAARSTAREVAQRERAFRRTLGIRKAARFDTEALPYLSHPVDKERRFDLGLAQRFVLNRVFELGWTIERFGWFDRNQSQYRNDGRSASKPERIGKKYQWLAWHEFLARVSDHFCYSARLDRDVRVYEGPWQDFDRDLDPSLLIASTARERRSATQAWWSRGAYGDWRAIADDAAWVAVDADLPPAEPLIASRGPDGRDFLVLETHREWSEPAPPGVDRYDSERREIWYMIKGYIVRRENADAVFEWGSRQNFFGRWMPESHEMTRVYFGELFWAAAFHYHSTRYTGRPAWEEGDGLPAPMIVASDGYMCEQGTFDCSLEDTVNIHLPSAELVEWLGLSWGGKAGYFVNAQGIEVAFDPSIFQAGPGAVLVDRALLVDMLDREGLAIIWTVLGEKRVLAPLGEYNTAPRIISGCYRLRDNVIEGSIRLLDEGSDEAVGDR